MKIMLLAALAATAAFVAPAHAADTVYYFKGNVTAFVDAGNALNVGDVLGEEVRASVLFDPDRNLSHDYQIDRISTIAVGSSFEIATPSDAATNQISGGTIFGGILPMNPLYWTNAANQATYCRGAGGISVDLATNSARLSMSCISGEMFGSPFPELRIAATGSWSLTPFATGGVPEPATWALMILGMAAVGAAMRRRARITNVLA